MHTLEFGVDDKQLDELRQAESLLDGAFAGRAKAFLVAGDELVKAISAFHELSAAFDGLPGPFAAVTLSAPVQRSYRPGVGGCPVTP